VAALNAKAMMREQALKDLADMGQEADQTDV
jgi:hypothetical protein